MSARVDWLWARSASSWANPASACSIIGTSEPVPPARRPPASARASSAEESSGAAPVARSVRRASIEPVPAWTASFTEVASPSTLLAPSLTSLLIPWSSSRAEACPLASPSRSDTCSSSAETTCCWRARCASSAGSREATSSRAAPSDSAMPVTSSFAARRRESAASRRPWAQPTSPAMRPMSWLAVEDSPEIAEAPSPSLSSRPRAKERSPSRAPASDPSAESIDEASPPAASAVAESVSRARPTASRAAPTVPSAPSRESARSSRRPCVARRLLSADDLAPSTSPAADPTAPWSLCVTVSPASDTNCPAIWSSSVVAPVSVTLGATALAFSLT